jgi:quercetin dioxygenase-like cupin family protein
MSRKGLCIVVMILSAITMCLAQDPTKVEASHYTLAFENASVQVVNVYYGPHEKSGMHNHPGGVVVVITGGHLRFTDQKGNVQEVYSKAGESRWFPPFQHKVENLGDTAYRAVYIGMKGKTAARMDPAKHHPKLNAQTEQLVAAYLAAAQTK